MVQLSCCQVVGMHSCMDCISILLWTFCFGKGFFLLTHTSADTLANKELLSRTGGDLILAS